MIRIATLTAAALAAIVSAPAFAADLSSSTVDRPQPFRVGAAAAAATQSAGTVGAMHVAVAGRATSADEVRKQSRGLVTAANPYWRASADLPIASAGSVVTKPGS